MKVAAVADSPGQDEYSPGLLSAFDKPAQPAATPARAAAAGLVELLTTREVEILRLIAAGMRNQEIQSISSSAWTRSSVTSRMPTASSASVTTPKRSCGQTNRT